MPNIAEINDFMLEMAPGMLVVNLEKFQELGASEGGSNLNH